MTTLPFKTDSYKVGHWNMYPENMTHMFSYLEPRKGSKELGDNIVVFGTRYYMEMLQQAINEFQFIQYTDSNTFFDLAGAHGELPNKEGWEALWDNYLSDGKLPIKIKALPEGTIVKPGTMVMSIENTDERFPWLVNYLETWLMNIWYPMTVASKSYSVRKLLENHYVGTGCDISGVSFAYHNFGSRGSVCSESAVIGGMAHLTSFSGTDNFEAIPVIQDLYNTDDVIGYSISATEHSVMCSWGKDREFDCVENYLEKHKNSPIIACVADTYNVFNFVNVVTHGKFKEKIESDGYPVFVIRPDSGEPISVLRRIINIMEKNQVLYSTNDKGFKVWNKYRIIWGDGITPKNIDNILSAMSDLGYAASNFAFGSGGDLMQNVSRDTFGFALKASAVKYKGDDYWTGISKNPITDSGKKSKEGKLMTIRWINKGFYDKKVNDIQTIKEDEFDSELHEDVMEVVFDGCNMMVNGEFPKVV